MEKTNQPNFSFLGKSITLRFSRRVYEALEKELAKDQTKELLLFGLFSQAKTADGSVLIVRDLFFPDKEDLIERTSSGVIPSHNFQATVYLIAEQRKEGILDVHNHPFHGTPGFSIIDQMESIKNAEYIRKRFRHPVTHAMIVFNRTASSYDAVVYDRSLEAYRRIDAIEISGRGIRIRSNKESRLDIAEKDARYSRQEMIPGWDQTTLSCLKVAVVGAGGNGAHFIQTLVSIGVGTEGWIAAIDPDIIEESNIPRIPYAFAEDVGRHKVVVAAEYAHRKNPKVNFYSYPCSVTEAVAIERIKGASVIICAPDNDGVRKACNELSVKCMIPMIDLGCDIEIDGKKVSAGGQVRVVLPGENACLVCCRGYDPSSAALELMDDDRKAQHAAQGYVIGHNTNPTPSVANLNALTSQFGISALLALVHGQEFGSWDYVHFDQLTGKTITANTKTSDSCPLCCREGVLGIGDKNNRVESATEPRWSHTGQ